MVNKQESSSAAAHDNRHGYTAGANHLHQRSGKTQVVKPNWSHRELHTHEDHCVRRTTDHKTLVLSTEMKTGQRFSFKVVPEVAYHVLEEVKDGALQVHFEDVCEKPVTLMCQHLRWIKVDQLIAL